MNNKYNMIGHRPLVCPHNKPASKPLKIERYNRSNRMKISNNLITIYYQYLATFSIGGNINTQT